MRILHTPSRVVAAVATTAAAAALLATPAAAAPVASAALTPTITPACKSPAKFPGIVGDTYVTYCEVCLDIGYREIRRAYKLRATDNVQIAIIYAKRDEYGRHRVAATQGCVRGFALRGKP